MNDERDTADTRAAAEAAVARAYRKLSAEETPAHLDRAVLARARSALRPAYARSRAWSRPVAWAATVVLSVVLVFETTRTPGPEAGPPPAAEPAATADFAPRNEDLLEQADRIAGARSNENRDPAVLSAASDSAGCPEEATREPSAWLECIEALEEAGLDAAAAEQRRLRREAFPDAGPP
jgi:hypothetical protein